MTVSAALTPSTCRNSGRARSVARVSAKPIWPNQDVPSGARSIIATGIASPTNESQRDREEEDESVHDPEHERERDDDRERGEDRSPEADLGPGLGGRVTERNAGGDRVAHGERGRDDRDDEEQLAEDSGHEDGPAEEGADAGRRPEPLAVETDGLGEELSELERAVDDHGRRNGTLAASRSGARPTGARRPER